MYKPMQIIAVLPDIELREQYDATQALLYHIQAGHVETSANDIALVMASLETLEREIWQRSAAKGEMDRAIT